MTKFDAATIWPSPQILPPAFRLLDMLPGLVAYFGPDLRYRYANATYAAWRGLEPTQITGRHCREIVGETNYPSVLRMLEAALQGNPGTAEYTLFDGENARDVQGSYVPDFDQAGQVRGVVVLVTDISVRRDLEARIVETERMFDDAFDHAPIGMAVTNLDGRMERVNRAFATMLGRSSEHLVGTHFRAITHPDDVDADVRQFRQLVAGRRSSYRMEKRYLRADGDILHTTLAVSAVRGLDGAPARFIAQIEDVSERRKVEREQQEVTARLTLAMEAVRGGFWHIDVETMRFEMSPSFQRFVSGSATGGARDLDDYAERIVPATREAASVQSLLDGTIDETSVEYELETIAGRRWMRCDRRLLRASDGSPLRIVGVTIDISEDHARQRAAEAAAGTDPLTGLLNRRGLDQRLGAPGSDLPMGVLAIDLDRFKAVNDSLGHAAGDAVLVEVAQRLRAAVRPSDAVARLGGDEFAVLLPGASAERLAAAAQRIEATLGQALIQGDTRVPISASVGAVMLQPDDGATAHERFAAAWRRADAALYAAKRARHRRWAAPV